MDWHRPEKARFSVREEENDLVVSCQYWQVRHSSAAGGNICSIVFPHGSGKSILAGPCVTAVGTYPKGVSRRHKAVAPASGSCLSYCATGETVCVESRGRLTDAEGESLPAAFRHRFEYRPWGYIRQRVTLEFTKPVPDAWEVMVAQPTVAPHLNEFALRPSHLQPNDWRRHCWVRQWHKFSAGESVHDYRSIWMADMPIYYTFLQRGVEGFDWFMGSDIDQWLQQVAGAPHSNEFMVYYRQNPEGYEVRTCPLSYHPPRVTLKGKYNFDFSMGLPFVQERVRPLVRAGGGMLVRQGKGWRFRSAKSVAGLAQGGIQLTRLHNDGPWPDGIFWRDGAYPPYPPRRMKEMDQCIREFHRHGMKVVPYFSLHEFHPEVPAFAKQAKNWQRTVDDAAMMIHNTTRIGEFGAQMCLASGWGEFRKKTIDVVLKNHDFDGIYYDWTMAMPCLNKGHHPRAHWDVEAFIDLLEWTRERVGPDGVMYLHMSAVPFAIAQNLANDILTFEEFSPLKVNPDMFPAASQYMKTCMEGVIPMAEGGKQPKLFALCALLNHVSPEFHDPGILKFLTKVRTIDFTRFKKFENHRTQAVRTSKPGIRAAIYWNEEEAMVLLANLTPERQPFSWKLDPRRLGWTGGYRVAGAGCRELGPLAFKYVTVRRSASWKD